MNLVEKRPAELTMADVKKAIKAYVAAEYEGRFEAGWVALDTVAEEECSRKPESVYATVDLTAPKT